MERNSRDAAVSFLTRNSAPLKSIFTVMPRISEAMLLTRRVTKN